MLHWLKPSTKNHHEGPTIHLTEEPTQMAGKVEYPQTPHDNMLHFFSKTAISEQMYAWTQAFQMLNK